MSDIPKTFDANYYDEAYFSGQQGGKQFCRGAKLDKWSYYNKDGDAPACKQIVSAFKTMFHPKTMLDIGGGRGTLVAYAREQNIEAVGFDWSHWATHEGLFTRCKPEWFIELDGTKKLPYKNNQFDLVIALDYMEHMYTEDLLLVIDEMYRVTNKYLFLEIDTVDGITQQGYVVPKGEEHEAHLEPNMVAGHVTVRTEQYWIDLFEHYDWELRRDMKHWFVSLVPEYCIRNWLYNSILIWDKKCGI